MDCIGVDIGGGVVLPLPPLSHGGSCTYSGEWVSSSKRESKEITGCPVLASSVRRATPMKPVPEPQSPEMELLVHDVDEPVSYIE